MSNLDVPLWRAGELAEVASAQVSHDLSALPLTGFSIDSRQLRAGDVFVAVPADLGGRFNAAVSPRDGHDFVASALAAGAHIALAQRLPEGVDPKRLLLVDDVLDALWAIGAAARERVVGDCIAVTGSSGKTTFKEYLGAALSSLGRCHRSEASLNNHLGVPMTLASCPRGVDFAVVEIGTNHPGEIGPLAALTRPTVSVLLNVQDAHIGHFGSRPALTAEKCAIAQGLTGRAALIVHDEVAVPADVPAPTLRFGRQPGSAVRLLDVTGDRATIGVAGRDVSARVPGGGRHRAETVAAVLAVLQACELPLDAGLDLAPDLVPAGRGRAERVGGVTLIDDSYNANPGSMAAALEQLSSWPLAGTGAVRLAILGDMAELGADSARRHREVIDKVQDSQLVTVGSEMNSASDSLPAERRWAAVSAADELDLEGLCARLPAGSVVLVKGSNGVFWQGDFVDRLRATLVGRS